MNTKPILFSTPMVQAILNGTKLQTRRVVKGKALEWITTGMLPPDVLTRPDTFICPYGEVGDVLWVRETWGKTTNIECREDLDWPHRPHIITDREPDGEVYSAYIYAADGYWQWLDDDGFTTEKSYWKPSIHMPKEACRLFLKIKDIRVERLQDISEEDAISEGVLKDVKLPVENFQTRLLYRDYKGDTSGCADARSSFMTLWKSINGEQSWNENLWVWVIEFERIEKPENF